MIEESFREFFYNSQLLKEGGNIFSTRRIQKSEILPTLKSLEKLTGLSLIDNTLGSTGKKESSGDIDVVIDSNNISKDRLIKLLIQKGVDPTSLKKTGIEVAFKSPIFDSSSKQTNDFIQVDFMFHDDPEYLKFYYSNNEKDPYKGAHRNILLSAIAKSKGLVLSMKGLFSRQTKELISKDPSVIAKHVLGNEATEKDLFNIQTIITFLRKHHSSEELQTIVHDAETTMGMRLV